VNTDALERLQRRRMRAVRIMQRIQQTVHTRIAGAAAGDKRRARAGAGTAEDDGARGPQGDGARDRTRLPARARLPRAAVRAGAVRLTP